MCIPLNPTVPLTGIYSRAIIEQVRKKFYVRMLIINY